MESGKAIGQVYGVWRVGDHPRRRDHSALLRPDGVVECTFGIADTVEQIGAALGAAGLFVHEDNTVTRANGEAMP